MRIAIASSMPPSQAFCFWNTCMTTRGWRPSLEQRLTCVVEVRVGVPAGAHLLDRQVERLRGEPLPVASARAMLELEARGKCGLGDLQLLGRRLRGGQSVLQLVPRLRERLRHEVARDCAPSSRRSRSTPRRRRTAPPRAPGCACAAGAKFASTLPIAGRRDERADEMAAAALVLLLRAVAVLVAADRDVLGAVIRGELACRAAQAPPGRARAAPRAAPAPSAGCAPTRGSRARRTPRSSIDASDARALHRQLRPRQRALHLRQHRERLGEPGRAAEEWAVDVRGAEGLRRRRDLDRAVVVPDRARPRASGRARARRSEAPCRRAGSSVVAHAPSG